MTWVPVHPFHRGRHIVLAAVLMTVSLMSRGGAADTLDERVARAELLAGLTAVEGPGVLVTLRNSPRTAPSGVDKNSLLIHEQDVTGILNALRVGGSEALAIGSAAGGAPERIVANTALREAPDGLVVNGSSLRPPYQITAIGEAQALRTELYRKDGVVRRAGLDTLQMVDVEDRTRLTLPPARSVPSFRYAQTIQPAAPRPLSPVQRDPQVTRDVPRRDVGAPSGASSGSGPTAIVRRDPGVRAPSPTRETPPPMRETVARRELAAPVAPAVQPRRESPPAAAPVAPTPGRAERPSPPRPAPVYVYGGRGLTRFHVANCRYGERIEAALRVQYRSIREAREAGRVPCPYCCEEKGDAAPID